MMNTKELDDKYIAHSYGRFDVCLTKGKGSVLYDEDGKKYIDFTSGIGVNSFGICDEIWRDAVEEQLGKVQHTSNLYYTEPCAKLAKLLCEKSGMKNVFFSNSGAEANEGMIKLARKYSYDKYGEGRAEIVTLRNSFHGRTVTTLKATGQDKFHQYFFPFTEGFAYAEANNMDSIRANVNEHTCAVMMELIQGEGGVMPLDQSFVQEVAAFCKERDLLLLVDEVQTGIGRTGSLFCFQQYGIKPDVVSMAKGLGGGVPIGAVMANTTCDEVLGPGTHATTFGGTPMCCASANAVLSEVTKPEFLQAVQEKGKYLEDKIMAMGSDKVKGVRGLGLMVGIVVDAEQRAEIVAEIMDKGVLVLTAGTNVIRLLPPLTISYEEMDEALAVMQSVLCK